MTLGFASFVPIGRMIFFGLINKQLNTSADHGQNILLHFAINPDKQ